MVNLTKVISTAYDSALRRIVKVTRMGSKDTQTGAEAAPYGLDCNPIKNMIAIYAETGKKGQRVVIGYINLNQLAGVGEARLYSTDADGLLKMYVHCKNDGTLLLGGSAKHLARFEELKSGFDELRDKVNDFIGTYNLHTHSGHGVATLNTETTTTASIDSSKIDEIKTL